MINDEEMHTAIDRIARSPDGHLLYRYFQKILCGVVTDDSALPAHNGRRRFAAELMGLMAKGIEASGGSSNAVVTFALSGGRPISRSGGAGRRVSLTGPNTESDPDPSAGG